MIILTFFPLPILFFHQGNTIDTVKASQFYASMQEPALSIQPSQPRVIVMQQTVSERLRVCKCMHSLFFFFGLFFCIETILLFRVIAECHQITNHLELYQIMM